MVVAKNSGTSSMKKHLLLACKGFQLLEAAKKFSGGKGQTRLPNEGDLRLCKVSEKVCREASNEMMVLAELPLAFIESLA